MVDTRLAQYIAAQFAKGVQKDAIEHALIQSGYSHEQIASGFSQAKAIPQVQSHGKVMVAVVVTLIFAIAGFWYFLNASQDIGGLVKTKEAIALTLEVDSSTATPGSPLKANVEGGSMGTSLKVELIEVRSGKSVSSVTQTMQGESAAIELMVPSSAQIGSYVLRVIANEGQEQSIKTAPITMFAKPIGTEVPSESCSDGVRDGTEEGVDCGGICAPCEEEPLMTEIVCEDNNACTANREQGGECVFVPITPCCGNGRCEGAEKSSCKGDCPDVVPTTVIADLPISEKIDAILIDAQKDPEGAARKCEALEIPDYADSCLSSLAKMTKQKSFCERTKNQRIRDVCLTEVAKETVDNSICDSLSEASRKDSCYLTFVLDYKDYSVCERVTNSNIRQSCFSLKGLS